MGHCGFEILRFKKHQVKTWWLPWTLLLGGQGGGHSPWPKWLLLPGTILHGEEQPGTPGTSPCSRSLQSRAEVLVMFLRRKQKGREEVEEAGCSPVSQKRRQSMLHNVAQQSPGRPGLELCHKAPWSPWANFPHLASLTSQGCWEDKMWRREPYIPLEHITPCNKPFEHHIYR